ncbi:hypothetical protein [uncultured Microbacterium sp.]|uniref:hypothetical protein n=1 Tax=uncultured Microbacterium sp. TaxID=191216 RepID=UPI0028DB471D|nr:hypothetical protein [uncultured Microbacterium sp.]
MATRSQAIEEARRLSERSKRFASNFGIVLFLGLGAVGMGALFQFLVAPGADLDDVATFETWGGVLLAGGAVGVISAWIMYSSAMSSSRRIAQLSQEHGFDPRDL